MIIFRTLLALTLVLSQGIPTGAKEIPISDISAFLNDLTTARGSFTQINPDGTISTGTLYIKRPGRIRFEYDPPDPALVLAGGGAVAIFDGKSNEPPQQFPLRRTPLAVILRRNVDLSQDNMITDHRSDDVTTTITAQDPKHPDIGYIELVFTADPVELRQWVITDQNGGKTTVILGDMERGIRLKAALFSAQAQIEKNMGNPRP